MSKRSPTFSRVPIPCVTNRLFVAKDMGPRKREGWCSPPRAQSRDKDCNDVGSKHDREQRASRPLARGRSQRNIYAQNPGKSQPFSQTTAGRDESPAYARPQKKTLPSIISPPHSQTSTLNKMIENVSDSIIDATRLTYILPAGTLI